MNQLIFQTFNLTLKKQIINELIDLYYKYEKYIDKEKYNEYIIEIVDIKFDFNYIDPVDIIYYKNNYQLRYNKKPQGRNANNIDWLKLQIKEFDYNNDIIFIDENKIINYKPRYVSRTHYLKKKNKCMARLWNDRYGGQCSRTKNKGDYCTIHQNILNKKGLLQFGRIDELKPEKDYFNYNKLNWID